MKRVISISFIALSTFFLLMCTVMPHHHHGQMPCFVMEFCGEDNVCDDEHTHHHNIPDRNNGTCILESEYIVSPLNDDIKPKVSYYKEYGQDHIYLFPVYYLAAGCVNYGAGNSLFKTEYGEYIILYRPSEAIQFHGLRAPPFIFS